jgi:hypothetical protein
MPMVSAASMNDGLEPLQDGLGVMTQMFQQEVGSGEVLGL